ncbi:MAG: hypothetical protein HQM02_10205, partial [Magnetococcales bacterium]|nr:hypothetical protein [Magnetococcales bacterium]
MSGAALTFVDPGPFDQIMAFAFPAVTYRFRILRDDGLLFAPESDEDVDLLLYDEFWNPLFSGNTRADPELSYSEEIPGLIVGFGYHAPHYTVAFSLTVVREVLQRHRYDFLVHVVTDGSRTLETTYPRCFVPGCAPVAITPGSHDLRIPFWSKETEETAITPTTIIRTTTFQSSVPYRARFTIANAWGRFRFPVMVVSWTPDSGLSGWSHALQFTVNCSGLAIHLPAQSIQGLTPPAHTPVSPLDHVTSVYYNLEVALALGSCASVWNATRVGVATDFGYAASIPFASFDLALFDGEYDLPGVQEPNTSGRTYR